MDRDSRKCAGDALVSALWLKSERDDPDGFLAELVSELSRWRPNPRSPGWMKHRVRIVKESLDVAGRAALRATWFPPPEDLSRFFKRLSKLAHLNSVDPLPLAPLLSKA